MPLRRVQVHVQSRWIHCKPLSHNEKVPSTVGFDSGSRGWYLRYIFLFNAGSAFEAHLDVIIVHDDGLDQCLHDSAVPVVGGVAVLQVFSKVVQPHSDGGVSGFCVLQGLLAGLQCSELLGVFIDLRIVVGVADPNRPFLLVQVKHPLLKGYDLLFHLIQCRFVAGLHLCCSLRLYLVEDRSGIFDHGFDGCMVGGIQDIFVYVVTVAYCSAVHDAVRAAPQLIWCG